MRGFRSVTLPLHLQDAFFSVCATQTADTRAHKRTCRNTPAIGGLEKPAAVVLFSSLSSCFLFFFMLLRYYSFLFLSGSPFLIAAFLCRLLGFIFRFCFSATFEAHFLPLISRWWFSFPCTVLLCILRRKTIIIRFALVVPVFYSLFSISISPV